MMVFVSTKKLYCHAKRCVHYTSMHTFFYTAFITLLLLLNLTAAAQRTDNKKRNKDGITQNIDSLDRGDLIDSLAQEKKESKHAEFSKMLKEAGAQALQKNIKEFARDTVEARQDEIIEKTKQTIIAATNFVRIGIDTAAINETEQKVLKWYNIAIDGVLINKGSAQTNRNLQVSEKILRELLDRLAERKEGLDKFLRQLIAYRNTIDSLGTDPNLYNFSEDSATAVRYFEKIVMVSKEIAPADSVFKQALLNASALQKKVNLTVNQLNVSIDEIEKYQEELAGKLLKREFGNLTQPTTGKRPFSEILRFSVAKVNLAFYFYSVNNIGTIIILVLLMAASAFFLRSLKKHLEQEGINGDNYSDRLVLRYPALSGVLIIISIFQFILPAPVFLLSFILWTISAICLTIIFRNYITTFWMKSWLALSVLFLLGSLDFLILQASRAERWFMFCLSLAGIITSAVILLKGRRQELNEKWILLFIGLEGLVELVALIANLYGRYNLAKTLMATGFFSVIVGILFLWTIRFINQSLSLAFRLYKAPDKNLFYINFKKVGNKAPAIFYVFMVLGWTVLVTRDIYAFRSISTPINKFLTQERTIGSYGFTISDVVVFFLIIIVSVVISRVVSFFAASPDDPTSKKKGLGSWLLLVRISIITLGLFLAFAAAGISMDKITIIIGALGVGIGFGLQTLVNNLVSGLIISFEKPVNVGDIVEVGAHSGVMKSIGFRSSVIYTWDGADIVIPNGDLLNQHLVNWTMANPNRRVEILVGVAYGTNLEQAKKLLTDLTSRDERILQSPPPVVLLHQFNNSSIDIKLFCWVHSVRQWLSVKSDLMTAITMAFKENNITIPFPQQDIYIHTLNGEKPEEG